MRNYKSKGVPAGYKENWKYVGKWSETKKRKGLWKFRFQATKRRKAKSYGSFGKGTTGAWKINGIQYIRKTGLGEYQTDFRGWKRPLKFNVKNNKYQNKKKGNYYNGMNSSYKGNRW